MIAPHGGKLTQRILDGNARDEALRSVSKLPQVKLSETLVQDAQNIARGVFSPLEGFMNQAELESVTTKNRLPNGLPWTIPILLDVPPAEAEKLKTAEKVCLCDQTSKPVAILELDEVFSCDKAKTARAVFGTDEPSHPGVASLLNRADAFLGGKISLIENGRGPFAEYNLFPAETRELFDARGWKTVVAFQTRNVPHAGHESLQKTVLGLADGLFIQPVIGKKKKGDFKDEVILKAYDRIIAEYFVRERVALGILPMEMRYAGPKEAIFHAIIRKNYGCTHIVIGRDHAGVGNFYHPEAAIEIFQQFPDLEIQPITIRGDFFYCRRCKSLASERSCPHPQEFHLAFSGTEIRKMLAEGTTPPEEIMRPEVFEVLKNHPNPFVE